MRLQFILSEIGIGLRRNMAMAISVILVTFVSLTFVGAAGLMQMQVGQMKDFWLGKVEVSIFMCSDTSSNNCPDGEATQDQIDAVKTQLGSDALKPYVQEVFFEDKQQAFENFKKMFSENYFQNVTADDMQVSYRVKLKDPSQYQVVADMFQGRPGIDEVKDQREIFDPLVSVLNKLTWLSIGLAVVMLLAAVLLITTTIKLSAMSRSRETGIMRLVGASNFFIQLPFMLEGALAALIGAALSVVGLAVGVKYLIEDWLSSTSTFIDYISVSDVWVIAPFLVIGGILLAAISSIVTLSRYTKI